MASSSPPHKSVALIKKVQKCALCPELPLGPRPVFQFDPRARILIAGQAPGIRVHESGIPFQDASGDRLRNWLGVDRETFYDPKCFAILPMAFCYPGTGSSGDLPPPPRCAETWRHELLQQLPALNLTIIIGRYARDWHLPERARESLTETKRTGKSFGLTELSHRIPARGTIVGSNATPGLRTPSSLVSNLQFMV